MVVITVDIDREQVEILWYLRFSDALKYSVVAGAVTGGGLTIIANAPNPAGISLLKKYVDEGFSPASLSRAALVPTAIMFVLFLVTS